MSGVHDAARAIRRTSHDVADRKPRTTIGILRKAPPRDSFEPLQVEVADSPLVLNEDDLSLGQGARRYHLDKGLKAGDSFVLEPMINGDWVAHAVLSEHRPPTNDDAVTPFYIPSDETFRVGKNRQALFSDPIEIDGTLEIDGRLIGGT